MSSCATTATSADGSRRSDALEYSSGLVADLITALESTTVGDLDAAELAQLRVLLRTIDEVSRLTHGSMGFADARHRSTSNDARSTTMVFGTSLRCAASSTSQRAILLRGSSTVTCCGRTTARVKRCCKAP